MKAETALNLVASYSKLTRGIKDAKKRIGESLEQCKGYSGKRGDVGEFGSWMPPRGEEDSKGREKDVHLWTWYTPDMQGDHGEYPVYEELGEWSGEECPHCYAAHLAIQERKALRKSLGSVKAAMTRLGAP